VERRRSEMEARESEHWHECPVCGGDWVHESRRCVAARELECEGCAPGAEEEVDVPF
jgi:hypothetical protein